MIKTIFFDFDGVLTVDATGSYTTCRNINKHIPEVDFEQILKCYRSNFPALLLGQTTHALIWKGFCSCIGKNLDIGILNEAFKNTPLNEEMMDLCRKLKGKLKLGIITDNSKERMDVLKTALGLKDIFDIIIVSGETDTRKDSEETFTHALALAGCKPDECVFIDNKQSNLLAPAKMGFKTIFYDDKKKDVKALIKNLKVSGVRME